jgi:flagellar biosynthetic protein FliR
MTLFQLFQELGLPISVTFFMVFLRVGAIVALIPLFGEQSVPARVKLGAAFAFSVAVLPTVTDTTTQYTFETLVRTGGIEIMVGLVIGVFFRLFILCLTMAGQFAAQSTSLAQAFGAPEIEPQPAMSGVLMMGGLALLVITGFPARVITALMGFYDMFPIGAGIAGADGIMWGIAMISDAFGTAFTLALPFLIAALLYNLALGIINKAMPQLMVSFVGAPALTLGALLLFAVSAPMILMVWQDWIDLRLMNPFGAAG